MVKFHSIALLTLFALQSLHAEASKEPFYSQVSGMVVRIEQVLPGGAIKLLGTGFFVDDEKGETFIVSARHVVDCHCDLRARVPSMVTATGKSEVVELRLPYARWIFHPAAGDKQMADTDVAVMRLPGIKDRSIVTFMYCKQDCPKDTYNQLADNPSPPDQIVIFGFPLDIGFTLKEPRPMTRVGVVSLISDDPFIYIDNPDGSKKLMPGGAYLIDARMFGGNSGGPVIVSNPFQQIRLGGLVTATNRSLDYGVATPVSQIAETLDKAKNSDADYGAWFTLDAANVPPKP
jgi:S1-C subfamily serine protease